MKASFNISPRQMKNHLTNISETDESIIQLNISQRRAYTIYWGYKDTEIVTCLQEIEETTTQKG